MAKKLWSIFGDMDKCFVTGQTTDLERHHIFGGRMGLRKKSEEMGFVVCLAAHIHPNGARNDDKNWVDLDHWFKRKCQEYFVDVQGHTRQEFYDIFGRFYDDRCDEKTFLNETFQWDLRRNK